MPVGCRHLIFFSVIPPHALVSALDATIYQPCGVVKYNLEGKIE
jgi:hypothetical protein